MNRLCKLQIGLLYCIALAALPGTIEAQSIADADSLALLVPLRSPLSESWMLTTKYGLGSDPFTGEAVFRRGINMAVQRGTPVLAPMAGEVLEIIENERVGQQLILRHSNGFTTIYWHLDEILVTKGSTVKAGQEIAKSGATGRCTGPVLFYQISRNERFIDPQFLLNLDIADWRGKTLSSLYSRLGSFAQGE